MVETKQAQKSLTYAGPKIWNQIPKQTMKMFKFTKGQKNFNLSKYELGY